MLFIEHVEDGESMSNNLFITILTGEMVRSEEILFISLSGIKQREFGRLSIA